MLKFLEYVLFPFYPWQFHNKLCIVFFSLNWNFPLNKYCCGRLGNHSRKTHKKIWSCIFFQSILFACNNKLWLPVIVKQITNPFVLFYCSNDFKTKRCFNTNLISSICYKSFLRSLTNSKVICLKKFQERKWKKKKLFPFKVKIIIFKYDVKICKNTLNQLLFKVFFLNFSTIFCSILHVLFYEVKILNYWIFKKGICLQSNNFILVTLIHFF